MGVLCNFEGGAKASLDIQSECVREGASICPQFFSGTHSYLLWQNQKGLKPWLHNRERNKEGGLGGGPNDGGAGKNK